MDLVKLRKKGIDALTNALGPVGMARFLQQFDPGTRDYTKDRKLWLKEDNIDSLAAKIKGEKKSNR